MNQRLGLEEEVRQGAGREKRGRREGGLWSGKLELSGYPL